MPTLALVSDDIEAVRERARRGGFPANIVAEITAAIGPETATAGATATTTG